MTPTRVLDFDAARAERKREPLTLKIGGQAYTLSAGLPASIALDMIRLKANEGENFVIPYEELDSIGQRLFGSETWKAILDGARLDLDELGELIKQTIQALQGDKDDGSPNRARRRAKTPRRASAGSKTGR